TLLQRALRLRPSRSSGPGDSGTDYGWPGCNCALIDGIWSPPIARINRPSSRPRIGPVPASISDVAARVVPVYNAWLYTGPMLKPWGTYRRAFLIPVTPTPKSQLPKNPPALPTE